MVREGRIFSMDPLYYPPKKRLKTTHNHVVVDQRLEALRNLLHNLPIEVFYKIFSFFDWRGLGLAALVCHKWKMYAENDTLWKSLLEKEGWVEENHNEENWKKLFKQRLLLFLQNSKLLETIKNDHRISWPFLYPVRLEDAPDYLVVIKNPIDLSTIEKKLQSGIYKTRESFISDLQLMVDNCRAYNHPSTVYYAAAYELEQKYLKPSNIRFVINCKTNTITRI